MDAGDRRSFKVAERLSQRLGGGGLWQQALKSIERQRQYHEIEVFFAAGDAQLDGREFSAVRLQAGSKPDLATAHGDMFSGLSIQIAEGDRWDADSARGR